MILFVILDFNAIKRIRIIHIYIYIVLKLLFTPAVISVVAIKIIENRVNMYT